MEASLQSAVEQGSLVFDRDEYAKKDFWDDRFKESNGFFDWYVNWPQIKPKYTPIFPEKTNSILMVGCGNSKLSEEMYKDGYRNITNMDISQVVLDKMSQVYSAQGPKRADFEYLTMDATRMNFRDNSFDLCLDKGTYDALACGPDSKPILTSLLREMFRVASQGVVLISNGTLDKRLPLLQETFSEEQAAITHCTLPLSLSAQIINILRSEMKDKPLSHAFKEPALLAKAISQAMAAQQRVQEEEDMKDPRKRLLRLMMKAKAKKDQEANNLIKQEEDQPKEEVKSEEGAQRKGYDPKRQEFVMMYVISKKK